MQEKIPILQMGDVLIVSIQVDMHDQLALQLQDDITTKVSETGARGRGTRSSLTALTTMGATSGQGCPDPARARRAGGSSGEANRVPWRQEDWVGNFGTSQSMKLSTQSS